MGTNGRPRSLSDVRNWLAGAPPGTVVPAEAMLAAIESANEGRDNSSGPFERPSEPSGRIIDAQLSWREKLWLVPAETRVGANELCEALGRSKHWLYRHTGPSAENRIPHRKLDGELVFAVGEVRTWIRENEHVIEAAPMESTELERAL
jgi:hypothetical protein